MVNSYIPKQKDIVLLDFTPTKGHEQKGYRPAIVISNDTFNKNTKMVILCPITSNCTNFPTHYQLLDSKQVKGSVLCEHIRSIDYEIRNLKFIEKASNEDFENIIDLLDACVKAN